MKQTRYPERLNNGQAVCSHVFTWMSGIVVDEPSTGIYKVKVDEDLDHHSEFIYISPDEIITIRDEAIESAERDLDLAQHKVTRTVKDLTWARENAREAREERQEAEAQLRHAKGLPT